MTLAFGTRTSSKNTWFCTSSPEVMTSGRIWMPGAVISTRTKVMPCCFLPVREVRTKANIQLASVACVVQTRSSPSATADMDSAARSDPASGSE